MVRGVFELEEEDEDGLCFACFGGDTFFVNLSADICRLRGLSFGLVRLLVDGKLASFDGRLRRELIVICD